MGPWGKAGRSHFFLPPFLNKQPHASSMDALNAYASDDDNDDDDSSPAADQEGTNTSSHDSQPPPQPQPAVTALPRPGHLHAAPSVSRTAGRVGASNAMVAYSDSNSHGPARKSASGDLVLHNNPTKDVLYQPVQGPQVADPAKRGGSRSQPAVRSHVAVDETSFAAERANFQRDGRAAAPTAKGETVWRTTLGYSRDRLRQLAAQEAHRRTKRPRVEEHAGKRTNKKNEPGTLLVQGSDDEAEYGVWGPPSAEEQLALDNSVTSAARGDLAPEQLAERAHLAERDRQRGRVSEAAAEESAQERLVERKMAHLLPPRLAADGGGPLEPPATQFCGREELDYRGRPWTAPPAGLGSVRADGGAGGPTQHPCSVPKQCVHRFTAPTTTAAGGGKNNKTNKGIHRIRLFPVTGHLLLSAGLDGTCHVWSTTDRCLMRTYTGHRAAVRDVQFDHDGSRFVSASFDRYLRLWDTASGQVLQTFTNRKVPYCVQFYPHDDNFFCVGCSDNKIVTYNATTAEITQEYNHHLAPVNAILFVEDNGTKMITSGDDKKVLVWEWDIGVPVKYISDPTMHSLPCLALHPSRRFFVGQSLDNHIAVFQASGKFALQKKKKFSGHVVSGYACEPAFAPDGRFLVSGDGNGALFVWDWNRRTILQKFRAHSGGPAAGCAWHPLEPSVLFTCGWDGTIKMWK